MCFSMENNHFMQFWRSMCVFEAWPNPQVGTEAKLSTTVILQAWEKNLMNFINMEKLFYKNDAHENWDFI